MPKEEYGQLVMPGVAELIRESKEAEYEAFEKKFEGLKTTDDCYTPQPIWEGLADWVAAEYGYPKERFLRPFKPGGDYQAEEYPEGCAVVDNPPFSILAQIVDWYLKRGIPFFLFAPTLTLINYLCTPGRMESCCVLIIGNGITYENGAEVNTSYITNMDGRYCCRIEADLREKLDAIDERLRAETKVELPKYTYPDCILCGKDYRLAKYGQTLRIPRGEAVAIRALDAQREARKQIFGAGLLISERAAAERAAAERAAAERAAATRWRLSERELRIQAQLSGTNLTHMGGVQQSCLTPGKTDF